MEIPREWTFERTAVAEGFDVHVREQLPWYELATGAVVHIARHYIPPRGLVYDIGASTGNIGRAIENVLDERRAELVSIEASAEMAARYTGPQAGRLLRADALSVEFRPFDLAILFLTLMFVPPADRAAFMQRLRGLVNPGGAIVVVDRVQALSGYPATVLSRLSWAGKLAAGVTPADIVAKELSLGGVQRPVTCEALAGPAVEWFRFGDFAGWLIEGAPA
jgi:tRNA (cmo5U34)-methyltransferase